jgi:glycosyltransferase involved in cell wall biosynthesis
MAKVYAFPAKSTQKVARTLEYCTKDIQNVGYMGVFNRDIFTNPKYKWVYYVVEWVLTDDEIDFINSLDKPVIPASNFVKFLSRNYRFDAIMHEVPIDFLNAKPSPGKKYDFFAVTYSLVRKTPYLTIKFANRTKHKGIILGDMSICNQIRNSNVKCLPFGVQSENDVKSYYMNSKAFLFLSGNEGFGLPPLEATYMGIPVIAYPFMPYLEWHRRDSFTIPERWLKVQGVYQHGTLHPVVIPTDEEEVLDFVEDMIGHQPDNNTLESIDYVKQNLTYCKEYGKMINTLKSFGIT